METIGWYLGVWIRLELVVVMQDCQQGYTGRATGDSKSICSILDPYNEESDCSEAFIMEHQFPDDSTTLIMSGYC